MTLTQRISLKCPGFMRRPSALRPAANGRHIALRFPRLDTPTLDELDAWLQAHPRAQIVMLADLPKGRALQRLRRIAAFHGVALNIAPPLNPKDLR